MGAPGLDFETWETINAVVGEGTIGMTTQPKFSFELFPPRTPEGAAKLPAVIRKLAAAGPEYFSVTYGAGGSTQEGTYETLMTVVREAGVEAAPHLTCIGSTREGVAEHLSRYREAGMKRIVALRGDLPATAMSASAPGEFHYANELVSFIRETHGERFQDRSGRVSRDASAGSECERGF